MRGVEQEVRGQVKYLTVGHLVELRCTGVAALPLHLLIYIHGVLGTVAITPQQIPPQFTHTTLFRCEIIRITTVEGSLVAFAAWEE